jgi:hypothetical protein
MANPPFSDPLLHRMGGSLAFLLPNVWRTETNVGFNYLQTQNLNQNPTENIFGVTCLYFDSNNNPAVGQFADALKTTFINGVSFRGLHGM